MISSKDRQPFDGQGVHGHSGCPGVDGDEKGVTEIVQGERMEKKCLLDFVGEFEAFIYLLLHNGQFSNKKIIKWNIQYQERENIYFTNYNL